ncbi:ABC transporter substrate-binding protein [Chelativorans intermedius]|uniref:ABC transporter substrate-binding protein n=1 Tax=Chelativorans intermedius TaxID=515947 RepID=A0ABV6D2Z0_9HYPH|nr:ABC transporter substrate-binding protein [Chelativorans intermedius]MCT8998499.1 ABC transporter substrate-binding protein [Chelativorans intermedius]
MRKLLLIAAAGLAMATAASAQTVKVSVTAIVEHPALDAVRDGVRDGLADAGYKEGENLQFVYESAQGNPATAAQIAREFVGSAPDVIVPISTPSAQAVAAATRDIPVVFSAVTDPLAAGLVESNEKPGGNVTGVSDLTPVADHVALIMELAPSAKSVGFVYNPGEANSVALLEHFRNAAEEAGLSVVEAAANKSADVQAAGRSLVGKADAMYVPTDNTVVSALEALISVAEENDLPLVSGDTDSVERGTLASIGFDYYQLGRQTADVVVRVLKGEAPGDIPVTFASGTDLVVNRKAAEAMGVTLPEGLVERASKVIE